ncbi:MAG TPA: pantoate--beta-alanine ligase [Candidatus Krumholzibacteria bacterium]
MNVFHEIGALQAFLEAHRRGRRVAFVPTMGALHAGHGECVARAADVPDALVVASIFVNPTQFGPGEDYQKYPRTLDADAEKLRAWKCDVIFAPSAAEMYPVAQTVWVDPGPVATPMCGRFRPGHFRGVATVVAKLFGIVRPDVAVFGQKDAQQALVIRDMVRQLGMGVELRLARTVREKDGLAMSSRNAYLSPAGREQALAVHAALAAARALLVSGERDARRIEGAAGDVLARAAIGRIDYVELRGAGDLSALEAAKGRVILAIAAHVENTRLIDNMVFDVREDAVDPDVSLY